MAVDQAQLGEFALDLLVAQSFAERFSAFEKVADSLNFDGLTYTFLPHFELAVVAQNKPPLFIKSDSFPDSFVQQHVHDGWFQHDFTVRKIGQGIYLPMDWKGNEKSDSLSQEEATVIEVAREDHGIKNAITIPTMPEATRTLGISGVSVISTETDRHFEMVKGNVETMAYAAQLFHNTCFTNMDIHREFIWQLFDDIDARSRKMIDALAKGRAVKNIADDFGVTPKSAHRIFDEIRETLGGITRSELVQIATVARLIESV